MLSRRLLVVLVAVLGTPQLVFAISATVTRTDDTRKVRGEVQRITKAAIVIKSALQPMPISIPANKVKSIDWENQPATLGLGISYEDNGRLDDSLKQLLTASGQANDAEVKTDIEFLIARVSARKALAERKGVPAALTKFDAFVKTAKDSFRYYPAMQWLGRLQLADKKFADAEKSFTELANAPFPDYKKAAQVSRGEILLAQDKVAAALAAFKTVGDAAAATEAEKQQKYRAMVGQATCHYKQKEFDQAITLATNVSKLAKADDTKTQARAYMVQGECYRVQKKTKPALMAYLHVDLVFNTEPEMHAEALFQLVALWKALNKPQRAADAEKRLVKAYPTSIWRARLPK